MRNLFFLSVLPLAWMNAECIANPVEKDRIIEVEVASILYDIETVIPISAGGVFRHDGVATYRLFDRDSIDYIQRSLRSKTPLEKGWHCDDSRVVCLLRHAKGDVDTLTFSGMYMSFKGVCCQMDTTLIRFFAARLPQQHKDLIEDYIVVVMRRDHFKRE